jgi:phosphinothricin acetyltransferase
MKVVQCEQERHAAAILAILNDAIVNSTALYDYTPRTMEMIATWFDAKTKGKFPVIGIESDAGELMAFGSYGTFRGFPAYKYSVEHSVYVGRGFADAALAGACCKKSSPPRKGRDTTSSLASLTPAIR